MRVLMLNYEYPPLGGGAANATRYLLKEFVKADAIQVDLVTSSIDEYEIDHLSKRVCVHKLNIGKDGNLHYQSMKDLLVYSWKAYYYSRHLLKKKNYDVCHAFFGIPCGFIAMKLGIPYVVSLRGSDVPFYSKRFYWLDSLIFKYLSGRIWKKARAVIANSQGLRELALESHPNTDIEVIPNGVDIDLFKPNQDSDSEKKEQFTIVSVGRLIERKGFDLVIHALRGMSDVRLVIVGEGPEKERLVKLAKDLSVNVTFLGMVEHDEMAKVYQGADMFILASKNEGMSNAMLEAMACGLPVVTSDVGGVQEFRNSSSVFVLDSLLPDVIRSVIHDVKKKSESGNLKADFSIQSWMDVYREYVIMYR